MLAALLVLAAYSRADGDQLGEIVDGDRVPERRDAHETVCVEVVAEQQGRVAVVWREEARPPVVDEVALVDRLEAERVLLASECREDGLVLALAVGPEGLSPDLALGRGLLSDRGPDARRQRRQ